MPYGRNHSPVFFKMLTGGLLSYHPHFQEGKVEPQKVIAQGNQAVSEYGLAIAKSRTPPLVIASMVYLNKACWSGSNFAQYTTKSPGFNRVSRIPVQEKALGFNQKDGRKSDRHRPEHNGKLPAEYRRKTTFEEDLPRCSKKWVLTSIQCFSPSHR